MSSSIGSSHFTMYWHHMPLGVGQGQNVGLKDFCHIWLCCRQGHPCFKNTCLVLFFWDEYSFSKSYLIDIRTMHLCLLLNHWSFIRMKYGRDCILNVMLLQPASARGIGIKVIHKWNQIPRKRPVIVQRYLGRPYLINDSKFDMRIYVYVSSYDPLRVYIFEDGLARFASCK